MLYQSGTLNCNGRLLSLEQPLVMGIINLTPDSFYGKSRYTEHKQVLTAIEKQLKEGADIIDIGGMSSRPGAEIISVDEEKKRVLPVLEAVLDTFPEAVVSIDTIHSSVARDSLDRGAGMINDISAGRFDPELYSAIAAYSVPYVLMHMQKKPARMQKAPQYENVVP